MNTNLSLFAGGTGYNYTGGNRWNSEIMEFDISSQSFHVMGHMIYEVEQHGLSVVPYSQYSHWFDDESLECINAYYDYVQDSDFFY